MAYNKKKREQKATVRWVLAAPERLSTLVRQGNKDEAQKEWAEISALLEKWSGVHGVKETRTKCLEALENDGISTG